MTIRASVVMGGPSAEHEISLLSGREILSNLDRAAYSVRAVVITEAKEFYHCDATRVVPSLDDLRKPHEGNVLEGPLKGAMSQPIWETTDVAVLGLHGSFGEDGLIQGFLDTVGVPYTGSGVYASAVGMNKIASKRLFESGGLTTPPYSVYGADHPDVTMDSLSQAHGFPCFAKCPQSGSSRLMGRADSREQLEQLLEELTPHASQILVESAIEGEEYSCPVLDYPDGITRALPPVLIRPVVSSFFDYEAKYAEGGSEEIVPAPCSDELTRRIRDVAARAHALLNCSGLSRTDMILRDDVLYVLELNTLPGLTPASLVPKAFAAEGGTYSQLLDVLIQTALRDR